uniref:Phosphate uptake regulator PhoU n=1 Tax=Fervidobacterium thailandense TaxID=1008305 RepID=A0A7C4W309_9BACT
MRWLLQERTEELKKKVTKQGWYVEDTLRLTLEAFKERNPELVCRISEQYWDAYNTYLEVLKDAQLISVSLSPHGYYLRLVFGSVVVSKVLLDISNRLNDIAENISNLVREPDLNLSALLPEMFTFAQKMLRKALRIYVDQNIEGAAAVCAQDAYIDRMFEKFANEVIEVMKENGRLVRRGTLLIDIARAIEEISDFAVQIIEATHYIVTAKFYKCEGDNLSEFSLEYFKNQN